MTHANDRITTRSGLALEVFRVGSAEIPLVQRLYANLTDDDLRARFLCSIAGVRATDVQRQLDSQGSDGASFLALDSSGEPVGIATLVPYDGGGTAEVAITVRSDRKGQGIGWSMLDYVRRYARASGVRALCSIENWSNRDALDLERQAGFRTCAEASDGQVRLQVPLAA